MTRLTLAGCALLALGAVGCDPDPPPGSVTAEPTWEVAFDTASAGSLSGVWGSGPSDVFVVGGTDAAGEIHHYDGTTWAPMSTPPDTPLLVWVTGFAPDDVYTVGTEGSMAHYDGTSWTPIDTGLTDDLWGIFGFAPNDMWIVGGDPFDGPPIILRYDGTTFTPFTVEDSENPQGAKALFKVWGIDGELFAVGQKGLILRFDGSAWKATPAGALADQDFVSLWGTSTDHIVAVGGRNNARVSTWDGMGWTTVGPEALGGLNAVHMTSPDHAVIGGIFGFIGRFDVASGEVVREAEPFSQVDIHAMWGDGAGKHYAVGGTFLDPHAGVALVRTAGE